ncbi:hypothetical protein [Paragemmobacter straminiformis]|uniref:Uncharacterized protein n=1 Tax=Paragemmobacter straminiformis TaxID=2045119 RepID=A0A842I6F4_9RHOB|nr:hypothetical protein [Gemmobacter straminiformis]MBC2835652.1 hypothetical protein [Gemmobacter straminiformis]
MTDQSFALLSVRMLAAGTKLRTGVAPDDYTAVEELSAGEAIYDPISRRFHDISDMSCGTLDRDRARDCGLDLFQLGPVAGAAPPVTCMIESRNLSPIPRKSDGPNTEPTVFYRLSFGVRVVIDTGTALCEMR